ncbi:MAG: hypothetical protein NT091_04045 [Candidatus Falkowbacteria bacterium]|nr:hypothetical protein [Candidatus Falkowbacteria bacterium]
MKTNVIHQLEREFVKWERFHLLVETYSRAYSHFHQPHYYLGNGPLMHWRELRNYIMHTRKGIFDFKKFMAEEKDLIDTTGRQYWLFPFLAFLWNKYSRRVFHLSNEVRQLIEITSFGQIKWNDLLLPFKAFAITLETPIKTEKDQYDLILVARIDKEDFPETEEDWLEIFLFSNDQALLVNSQEARTLQDCIDRKDWGKAILLIRDINKKVDGLKGTFVNSIIYFKESGDRPIVESLEKIEAMIASKLKFNWHHKEDEIYKGDEKWQIINAITQIVAGTCLYLATLRTNNPCKSSWQKPPPKSSSLKLDPHAISLGAQICTLSASHKLTPTDKVDIQAIEDIRQGKRPHEKCAHFRKGHFRCLPRKANDPNAPKCIIVKPALVRPDRLKEGQLPGGAKTTL